MITRSIGGAMLALLATAALSAAQDKPMPMDKKMDKMDKQMEKTLTGCVTKSASGVFMLDHAMAADMAKMKDDAMAPAPALASKNIDLSKHVGHKVSVKGREDMMDGKTTFTVKSLKMIANSCGNEE